MLRHHDTLDACLDDLLARVGSRLVLGTPLGIGKPNHFLNRLYARIKADPDRQLHLLTALSLQVPQPSSALEKAFLQPFLDRVFAGYPELDYVTDLRAQRLPANVTVTEFFLKSGDYLHNDTVQAAYLASHYTHAARDMLLQGLNAVVQAVAVRVRDGITEYSYASNPDVTLDLLQAIAAAGTPVHRVLVVNRALPFMENDARVDVSQVDAILDCPEGTHALFQAPNGPVSLADYAIGLHAASLVRDGGTLQIGIGSLGDAICQALILRDRDNPAFRTLLERLGGSLPTAHLAPFAQGLYGCSEMFVNGFMALMRAGIIRREVFPDAGVQTLLNQGVITPTVNLAMLDALVDHGHLRTHLDAADVARLQRLGILRETVRWQEDTLVVAGEAVPARLDRDETRARLASHGLGDTLHGGHVMTGGFFLGPGDFYDALRGLDDAQRRRINMTAISFINQLYGHEALAAAQRKDASFINTCMMMTLLGAAVSDGLDSGRVVSGVGGQYNFVAMAHALPDAQSILMLRATRETAAGTQSNLIWQYGHTTIPRQLRDVVITEYGVAELRGQCDGEVIKRLLAITDSRFQEALLAQAKANGKIDADYVIPEAQRHNLPVRLADRLALARREGLLPDFPFGTDLTEDELQMARRLKRMQALQSDRLALLRCLWQGRGQQVPAPWLARLGLDKPTTLRDRLLRRLFIACG